MSNKYLTHYVQLMVGIADDIMETAPFMGDSPCSKQGVPHFERLDDTVAALDGFWQEIEKRVEVG